MVETAHQVSIWCKVFQRTTEKSKVWAKKSGGHVGPPRKKPKPSYFFKAFSCDFRVDPVISDPLSS